MAEPHTPTPPAGPSTGPRTAEARLAAARKRIAAQARRARLAMVLERATQALWPLWAVLAAFLGLSLLGLPQALPFWPHVALLAVAAAAAGATGWRAWRQFRLPSDAEARHRLDGGAPDRPVAAIDDVLAGSGGDPATGALWRAHQARMAERAATLRAAAPDLRVSAQDRFALRHAALLALGAGIIAQWGDGGTRLAEALTPAAAAVAGAPAPSLEAWASPPAHTGVPPLYLTERVLDPAPITLPRGTEVTLRVFDSPAVPRLEGMAAEFSGQGAGTWDVTVTLEADTMLAARSGSADLGGWQFAITPDIAPTIRFTEEPEAARSGALQFAFAVTDDYGVVAARAEVRLDDSAQRRGVAAGTVFEPIVFELPLPLRGAAAEATESVVQDLVEHPWGGLPVVLTIIAEDGAGQESRDERRIALPQRPFFDPLARAIVEERRSLGWSLGNGPRSHRLLEAVSAHPEDIFRDVTAYMTLRTAIRRLDYALAEDRLAAETPGIVDLLWLAALRIEDGDLSAAEQRLRQLQQELSDAIERGAEPDEIDRLMQELREAMAEFLREMAEEAQRDQAEGRQPQQPADPDQMLTPQDLDDMLAQIEEMLRSGMMEEARQMLQALQQLLENLQMAQPGQPQEGQGGPGDQAMQELQDMIGEQQGLADRSFDALRQGQQQGQGQQGRGQQGQGQPGQGQQGRQGQGQPGQGRGEGQGQGQGQPQFGEGPGGGPDLGSIARDQEALRQMLEGLRGGLPGQGQSDALDRAERSMGQARDALREGDADGALQNQVEALDALREGAQDLAQQMQQGQPGQGEQAGRDGRGGNVRDEDPFGRPRATDGPLDGDSVRVPDASMMKRARELLDEIRRRSGERTRPAEELDYLRRLLDRF
jgi:uncharacterized protein (TIGR02302 family)